MGIKKKILHVILFFLNFFVRLFPIDKNRIVFVSLESSQLESDMALIYEELLATKRYSLHCILMKYDKKSMKNNFSYMVNAMQQIWYINRSKMVILNTNNYVVSNFKRKGVRVIQVWHATGAIKKFGNAIKREYPIRNYDYVIANSEYWKEPYSQAFGIKQEQVVVTGMPRVDHLLEKEYHQTMKERLLLKYPILKGKKVILYAPTFRGNIYQGFTGIDFDGDALMKSLGKEYVLVYKLHPLLKDDRLQESKYAYNMNHEDIHDLFTITDILISDFSSIIFDFSLLHRPLILYVPDLEEYSEKVGVFLDYKRQMPGSICRDIPSLITTIKEEYTVDTMKTFKDTFFTYQDGQNLSRVIRFINQEMMK